MPPALVLRRSQRLEDRPQVIHRLIRAAHHHAVALFQSPHTARGPAIDKVESFRFLGLGAPLRVLVVRVAAVDENIALLHQWLELRNRLVHRIARRHHQPYRARRLHALHQVFQRVHALRPVTRQLLHHIGVEVEPHHRVAALAQPRRHVEAHLSQADQSQFHRVLFPNLSPKIQKPFNSAPRPMRAAHPSMPLHPCTESRACPRLPPPRSSCRGHQ